MRRRLLIILPVLILVAGCGGKFELPTERRPDKPVPSNHEYAMLQTWDGMDGIQDILLTQGQYSQLFLLFNYANITGGPDVPRGVVRLYPFANPVAVDESYFPRPKTLFNPVALCAGQQRLLVLDQGDTCMAKYDTQRGTCEADPTPVTPTSMPRPSIIWDYRSTWRVREYVYNDPTAKYSGDTLSTFTDTTFVQVYGIASDDQGRIYVSGVAAVLDTSKIDVHQREREFSYRVFRYARGVKPGYGGLQPEALNWDANMPGAGTRWHRDTTWFVGRGTGTGFVLDPRGIAWSPYGSPALLVADRGNSQIKTISPNSSSTGYLSVDGSNVPPEFSQFLSPEDVAADLQGYLYAVDRGSRRVVRFDPFGQYLQTVNVELNSHGQTLLDPVTVGVDDSVAYVGDRGLGQVIRYKRRP